MAETDMTRDIKRALKYYKPREIGGININTARGSSTVFEVPVKCGTTAAGMIDCVRISEYFGDKKRARVCRSHTRERSQSVPINCPIGITESNKTPELCDNERCQWNAWGDVEKPKVLVQCFEIKISKSDFHSKNGHNFVGNLNYYVIPAELYENIRGEVPEGIGVILYKASGCVGHCRRKQNATFKPMTDEEQKWMILNVLKRITRQA